MELPKEWKELKILKNFFGQLGISVISTNRKAYLLRLHEYSGKTYETSDSAESMPLHLKRMN
jgi:hypothetical protein